MYQYFFFCYQWIKNILKIIEKKIYRLVLSFSHGHSKSIKTGLYKCEGRGDLFKSVNRTEPTFQPGPARLDDDASVSRILKAYISVIISRREKKN